uniref:Uncharacterized protein n=1 Tax=Ananas comosus var. bracteatus TaxID=296719 RepID=A0A6V7NFD5_ANACO|nr:unnamed protein product [Ananas comosus var. bracteatus]
MLICSMQKLAETGALAKARYKGVQRRTTISQVETHDKEVDVLPGPKVHRDTIYMQACFTRLSTTNIMQSIRWREAVTAATEQLEPAQARAWVQEWRRPRRPARLQRETAGDHLRLERCRVGGFGRRRHGGGGASSARIELSQGTRRAAVARRWSSGRLGAAAIDHLRSEGCRRGGPGWRYNQRHVTGYTVLQVPVRVVWSRIVARAPQLS